MVPPHWGQMRESIVGISIEAVVADHNLSFIRNVRGYPGYKLKIIHGLCIRAVLSVLIDHLPLCLVQG